MAVQKEETKVLVGVRKVGENSTDSKNLKNESLIDSYLHQLDWQVKENANMSYSLQGMRNYISNEVTKDFWLKEVYAGKIAEAHKSGDLHIHDLGELNAYCCGWDLQDLLMKGFGGVAGKINCTPAKHFSSILGQMVNFIYTLQGETAGAQAFSNFDTLLAPFVRYDGLSYSQVKQQIQSFVYNVNVPTRVGFQTPFFNITMDINVPKYLADQAVVVGGVPKPDKYGDFQREMDMINQAYAEVMLEGDADGRIFTFPIPTYNVTKDFDWDDSRYDAIWKMTAKYGIPYFANYINSDMNPEDARSMCCRLRLDNRELRRRGGLFSSNPLTGSIGVVTINMPRIAFETRASVGETSAIPVGEGLSFLENHDVATIEDGQGDAKKFHRIKDQARNDSGVQIQNNNETPKIKDFNPLEGVSFNDPLFQTFIQKVYEMMELASESLEIKRKYIEDLTSKGLYPFAKVYLDAIKQKNGKYWSNHFSTIGLLGMNEAAINLFGEDITTEKGQKFASDVLELMAKKADEIQERTGNLYNLEASPAEGTSYRLARLDMKKHKVKGSGEISEFTKNLESRFDDEDKQSGIIFANHKEVLTRGAAPYYTNSSQLPVGHTQDVFEALDLQDNIQTKYTGGTVFHGFLGEKVSDVKTTKKLVKAIASGYHLPYFTLTPTFSISPTHGYLSGEYHTCPYSGEKCEVYSRIVGYIRPVDQWNEGKKEEFKDRVEFRVN